MASILNPLQRNELEKAIMGRGVDYETTQLIVRDFDIRIEHMSKLTIGKPNDVGIEPMDTNN